MVTISYLRAKIDVLNECVSNFELVQYNCQSTMQERHLVNSIVVARSRVVNVM